MTIQTVTILGQFEGDAVAKLQKLAKRAAKYGQEITWTIERRMVEVSRVRWDGKTEKALKAFSDITVTGEAPRVGEFKFIAELTRTPGGVIIQGGEVGAIGREWDGRCEHCNKPRGRTLGYVVEDASGARKIVGKSCLRDHLGMDVPAGALGQFARELEIAEMGDEEGGWGGGGRWEDETLGTIAVARAVMALYGWVPKAGHDVGESTAGIVGVVLHPRTKYDHETAAPVKAELRANGDHYRDTAQAVIDWGVALNPRGDYEHNLKIALACPYIADKTFGLVVSAAAAYDRQIARIAEAKAKAAAAPPSHHIGKVGERLTAAVEVIRKVGLPDNGWGESTIVAMRTEDGALISWKTASVFRVAGKPLEVGDKFKAKFTVKDHVTFRDVPETRVARCALVA